MQSTITAEVCSRCIVGSDDAALAARAATTTLLALLAPCPDAQLEFAAAHTEKSMLCVCRCCCAAALLVSGVAEINHSDDAAARSRGCSTTLLMLKRKNY
jgi:hypothetical protein